MFKECKKTVEEVAGNPTLINGRITLDRNFAKYCFSSDWW